jgi:type 1 glutamine amidotransferase
MFTRKFVLIALIVVCMAAGSAVADEGGFKPIFDGKTLDGWKASEMSHWSVADGAIVGLTTPDNPAKGNQFLVWQLGELDDFDLKLEYRISGTDSANSGIQIRSQFHKEGFVSGYQADIDRGGTWVGALFDERGRGMLAARGQKTTIAADGKKNTASFADGDGKAMMSIVNKDGWNEYEVIAKGNHITLKLNGKVTAEVIDNDKKDREFSGVLALQLHAGPPMKIEFKDIQLKRLKMTDKKKIVLVAGPRSHGYDAHEHKAGNLLLAKWLNENVPGIFAATYDNGWPKDPTAFDNADAVSIFCDGEGGHVAMPHLDEMDAMAKKGMGIACLHYGVEIPKGRPGDSMLNWTGGYFETFWSVNPHWKAEFKKFPNHPVTRGVKPFAIDDEWYYHMRFPENMKGVTPVLTAIPPDSTRRKGNDAHGANPTVFARKGMPEHVAWVYERPDGGRGFGFTGGHWHHNWAHNDYRKIVLNALVWISGLDVPENGVPSQTPTIAELEADQDYPKSDKWDPEKIKKQIEEWNG